MSARFELVALLRHGCGDILMVRQHILAIVEACAEVADSIATQHLDPSGSRIGDAIRACLAEAERNK